MAAVASTWVVVLGVLGGVVLVVALYHFNRMVQLRNRCREAWANVDAELKRRYDLVPNLVAAVKGYAAHERDLLEHVTAARTRAMASQGTADQQAADERPFVRDLGRLLAVAEAYPELKASEHFGRLQEELAITEDRLQAARRFYNANVRDYRDLTRGWPGLWFAALFRFGEVAFFEVERVGRVAPSVGA